MVARHRVLMELPVVAWEIAYCMVCLAVPGSYLLEDTRGGRNFVLLEVLRFVNLLLLIQRNAFIKWIYFIYKKSSLSMVNYSFFFSIYHVEKQYIFISYTVLRDDCSSVLHACSASRVR